MMTVIKNVNRQVMWMDFHPGSVLILDVTASSNFPMPTDLSTDLGEVVTMMKTIGKLAGRRISALHRRGDEVFVVAEGYSTAYLLSFWTTMIWKHREFPLYSGIGYGDLGGEVPTSDKLEFWNSAVAKAARSAIDALKETRRNNRTWLRFDTTGQSPASKLLNEYVLFQDRFLKDQTDVEHLASVVSLVEERKGEIARLLGKDISTVSRQLKTANIDLILVAKRRIVEVLEAIENQTRQRVGAKRVAKGGGVLSDPVAWATAAGQQSEVTSNENLDGLIQQYVEANLMDVLQPFIAKQ